MEKLNIPVDWHYQQEGVTEFTRDENIFDVSSNVSSLNQSLTAPELTTLPSFVRQFEAQKKLEERKKLLQEFDEEMQKVNVILKHTVHFSSSLRTVFVS